MIIDELTRMAAANEEAHTRLCGELANVERQLSKARDQIEAAQADLSADPVVLAGLEAQERRLEARRAALRPEVDRARAEAEQSARSAQAAAHRLRAAHADLETLRTLYDLWGTLLDGTAPLDLIERVNAIPLWARPPQIADLLARIAAYNRTIAELTIGTPPPEIARQEAPAEVELM